MPDLKQELTELIEAFAVARQTGNQRLIQRSATDLVALLERVEITEPQPIQDDDSEG